MKEKNELGRLEENYEWFYERLPYALNSESVDYFGINITSDDNSSECEFKVYYDDKYSRNIKHPLIDFLWERHMVFLNSYVKNSGAFTDKIRFDLSVKNRIDENIMAYLSWIEEKVPGFAENRKLIDYLAAIKITEVPDYNFAALYHVGFDGDEKYLEEPKYGLNTLKFHFYNRKCKDPEKMWENTEACDEYVLTYLRKSELPELVRLADISENVLKCCGGHLWITGLDIKGPDLKYKVYMNNQSDVYTKLSESLLDIDDNGMLIDRIKLLEQWNLSHNEWLYRAFALCLDSKGAFSINFYYRFDEAIEELLVLLDNSGKRIGYGDKMNTHVRGQLHAAFSIFVFDVESKKILLQKRSQSKYHSGGLWSNSCCSHIRKCESQIQSLRRCMLEELGVIFDSTPAKIDIYSLESHEPQICKERIKILGQSPYYAQLGQFQYFAQFDGLAENELDTVYLIALSKKQISEILFNPKEISELKWIGIDELNKWLKTRPQDFTSWFQEAYEIFERHIV